MLFNDKQFRSCSEAAFRDVWPRSTLSAKIHFVGQTRLKLIRASQFFFFPKYAVLAGIIAQFASKLG